MPRAILAAVLLLPLAALVVLATAPPAPAADRSHGREASVLGDREQGPRPPRAAGSRAGRVSSLSGPWYGLQGGANDYDPRVTAKVGAGLVRVEFAVGAQVSELRPHIAAYAARGIRVVLLAGFHGRLPSPAEARNVAAWAHAFGPGGTFWAGRGDGQLAVRHIEFGNETSYAYQGTQREGGEYARRVRQAGLALAGPAGNPRVGLLVQADGANQSDRWVDQMYDAVGDLHRYADGWTVHPYGPRGRWQPRIDELIARTAARGAPADLPIDVTEWGLATDDGRCLSDNYGWDRCMTYGQAAEALRSTAADMHARYGGRLRHFLVYHARDGRPRGATADREHYFGALTNAEADKGAFTARIRALMSGT